jgi:flagella basal body P-ring formation protein FlgA
MIRAGLAVALVIALDLAFGHSAAAASAEPAEMPRLKELVTVSSDVVRIGDLVDNAGAAADVPVFRAPDLGQTGAVAVARITDALRPYDMTRIDTAGLGEVVVTRLSRPITQKEITDRIARAVAGQFGFGDARNLAVILDRDIRLIHVEASATAELMVYRMNVEPRTGRFDITFELPGSVAARRMSLRFTGSVSETLETAAIIRAVRPGQVIKASDVVMERKPRAEVGNDGLGVEQAVGLAAKTALRAGQALHAGDLIKPQIVQRNEAVLMSYEVPGIRLTVRGKALETGAIGDMIGVLNSQSNRTIQATITGAGRVAILAPGPIKAASNDIANNDQQSDHTQ